MQTDTGNLSVVDALVTRESRTFQPFSSIESRCDDAQCISVIEPVAEAKSVDLDMKMTSLSVVGCSGCRRNISSIVFAKCRVGILYIYATLDRRLSFGINFTFIMFGCINARLDN